MKAGRKPREPKLQVQKHTNTGIPHPEKETRSPILFVILLRFQGRARLEHHPFHITLSFCFDRKASNLVAPKPLEGNKPKSPHIHTTQKRGQQWGPQLTKQREARECGYSRNPHQAAYKKEDDRLVPWPFPSAEVTTSQPINGFQSAAGGVHLAKTLL